jgi:predicted dehydrogenase/threonine dehydrogenase-like Zn-dependent dehydrogenase
VKQVLQAAGGGRTRVADVPEPSVRRGGVLVATEWSLISAGTERLVIDLATKSLLGKAKARPDLVKKTLEKLRREGLVATYRTVSGRLAGDVPLGYSAAGRVIAVGEGVTDVAVGDRVACAGAGYANHAEVICVPRNLVAPVPAGLDSRAACVATMGAIALHGVRTADVRLGEVVVVIGLGLLGQLAVQFLRASGARVVALDLDPGRVRIARDLGAEVAICGEDPEPIVRGMTGGHGADAALVCAASESSEPLGLAARLLRRGGVLTLVGATGMDLDRRTFYGNELSLRMSTSYGPGRYDAQYEEKGIDYPYPYVRWTEGRNLRAVMDLVATGAVDLEPLMTHEFEIGDAERAYELVTGDGGEPFMGILLRYGAAPTPLPAQSPATGGATSAGRVGLIGAGLFATAVLLPALRSAGATLQAVSTASGSTADAVARKFAFARVATSSAAVISADDVDAVVVATRHDSHAELVAAALRAGKACFVEKPLAIRREELAEVLAAMQERPGLVCVGFNRRFAPAVEALRSALAHRTSPLHARYRINAGRMPEGHWTLDPDVGGGRILGEVCHFVDLLSFIAGAPVAHAQATPVGDDGVSATLRFDDGSTATLDYLSGGAPSMAKEHIDLHWEGRSFVMDDFRELTEFGAGKSRKLWTGSQDKGHGAEIAAFVAAVKSGGDSPVPFEGAVASTRATFAIADAARTGRAVDANE